jgi:hypothetical protein
VSCSTATSAGWRTSWALGLVFNCVVCVIRGSRGSSATRHVRTSHRWALGGESESRLRPLSARERRSFDSPEMPENPHGVVPIEGHVSPGIPLVARVGLEHVHHRCRYGVAALNDHEVGSRLGQAVDWSPFLPRMAIVIGANFAGPLKRKAARSG